MNHLLHQFSWHQYLISAVIIAVIYYLAVVLRWYRPELQMLLSRFTGKHSGDGLTALQYIAPEAENDAALPSEPQAAQQHVISEGDFLASELKASIAKAADKPFAPAILLPQIKQIIQKYQALPIDRAAINHLIVNECEKTGTALLTEEEVDQWWSN